MVCVFLFFCTVFLYPEKVAEFSEIMQPVRINIDGNEMFVVDARSKIAVFSISDLRFLRDISRSGEGPGEFRYLPFIKIFADSVFLGALNKVMVFSREGKLIEEKRLYPIARALPVKDNYVSFGTEREGEETYRTVNLLNTDLKKIKALHRQLRIPRRRGINPIRDYLGFDTFKDKIFIADSRQGFVIEVFNSLGEKLDTIEKKVEKIRISDDFKGKYVEQLEKRPGGQGAEWRVAIQRFGVEYQKFFPDIREFLVVDDKIYVQTYKTKEGKTEFIVLDSEGNTLQAAFLPLYEKGSLVDKHVYTFYKDYYYYLKYSEDNEIWELHRIKLKK